MNQLEKTRTQRIVTLHNEIVGYLKTSLEKAIEIGGLLTEHKETLAHGEFTPWINTNLPFTDRTAQNYMRLYRERDRLKTESVSDLKSAYKLLALPKKINYQSSRETLTLFDEDTICMRVGKEITDRCSHAILHPIKMDNYLDQYRGDPDICCTDILEIVTTREQLTLADYREYVPLKIAAIKAEMNHDHCIWEIEDAEEEGRHLSPDERQEIESRAKNHMDHHDKINKQITAILRKYGQR
jgi:hypothetical protein